MNREYEIFLGGGRGTWRRYRDHAWSKNLLMALLSEYLSSYLCPDVSADALGMINIGK